MIVQRETPKIRILFKPLLELNQQPAPIEMQTQEPIRQTKTNQALNHLYYMVVMPNVLHRKRKYSTFPALHYKRNKGRDL